ncbi:hypothetical protein KQI61_15525 [Anaerocolumna aminovalerica]|uniref:hypothetical protein n=1 Tax=Anaerocolumna aminovalerica TaxID=1527 RepID=UPI001C0EC6BF|nr:hypothetical protein [Anaerocolumna aminovalerica]MBU5333609.1 hypothetical protein [Anaerocolumna aminovalerica]
MFNYEEFKNEMENRGHEVIKRRNTITINPNNNYLGYAQGFLSAYQIVEGFENDLIFKGMSHFNTHVYYSKWKIA